MKTTHHSEYLKLKEVYIKPVKNAFVSESNIDSWWEKLNFLSKPNLEIAIEEYKNFEAALLSTGSDIFRFPKDRSVNMDSVYCRDAAIATDFGMIICTMGKEGRINEPNAQKQFYLEKKVPVLGEISGLGTVEGGDVAWLDESTLAVGHTYRTNDAGIAQLKNLLEPKGIQIIVVELPHYKGKDDVFHLMSILSPVDKNLAVVYSPLMPITFRNDLLNRGFELIEVPEEEFESMGCNVLAISPRKCLMVAGNPITKALLEKSGCIVMDYDGSEISVKGGGGPTCLTRPMLRIQD
jgi:N-dimethylarginine dimethylaminohydrolase